MVGGERRWLGGRLGAQPETALAERFDVSLDILQRHGLEARAARPGCRCGHVGPCGRLRALLDLMPNAWLLWDWVNEWVAACGDAA